jgi:hypothetical protein
MNRAEELRKNLALSSSEIQSRISERESATPPRPTSSLPEGLELTCCQATEAGRDGIPGVHINPAKNKVTLSFAGRFGQARGRRDRSRRLPLVRRKWLKRGLLRFQVGVWSDQMNAQDRLCLLSATLAE